MEAHANTQIYKVTKSEWRQAHIWIRDADLEQITLCKTLKRRSNVLSSEATQCREINKISHSNFHL